MYLANKTTKLPSNNVLYGYGYGYDPNRVITTDIDEMSVAKIKILNKCPQKIEKINDDNDLICADAVFFNQNPCEGDSGSAIVDYDNNIFGIVAYGTACDKMKNDDLKGTPKEKRKYANSEVYTNVTYYLPFICGIIGINEDIGCLLENIQKSKEQPYFEIQKNGQISKNAPNFEEENLFDYEYQSNELIK